MATKITPAYTAEVTATGSRKQGRARSTDGNLELDITLPGSGAPGTNPEEIFAAGFAACFANAVILSARRTKKDPGDVGVTARVHIGADEAGGFGLAVELDVMVPGLGQAEAEEVVGQADRVCPYSNATRGNIEVEHIVHAGAGAEVTP
jgi:Ohr subfamily peroxiredoxin